MLNVSEAEVLIRDPIKRKFHKNMPNLLLLLLRLHAYSLHIKTENVFLFNFLACEPLLI